MQSQPRAKSYAGQEHVKDGQFCKWLSNARDWSISRKTYWAARFRCEGLMIPRADRLAAGRIIGIGPGQLVDEQRSYRALNPPSTGRVTPVMYLA
jgi:hypothetical protein